MVSLSNPNRVVEPVYGLIFVLKFWGQHQGFLLFVAKLACKVWERVSQGDDNLLGRRILLHEHEAGNPSLPRQPGRPTFPKNKGILNAYDLRNVRSVLRYLRS
jgi:hypothetical protein